MLAYYFLILTIFVTVFLCVKVQSMLKGDDLMIEIYLFINPLDGQSLKAEQTFLKLMEKENKKIQLRLIPVLNLQILHHYLKETRSTHLTDQSVESFYSAAFDFKAVLLQGKKKGRSFLLNLQKLIAEEKHSYTEETVQKALQLANVNEEMFYEDRQSDFVKKCFNNDQKTAREMGIKMAPSAVIFNYTSSREYGTLITNFNSVEVIQDLLRSDEEFQQAQLQKQHNGVHALKTEKAPHLRLL